MSLPPLFSDPGAHYGRRLLLQRGPGFFAATGTVVFGLFAKVGSGADAICDHRLALWYAGFLFLPAALVTWWYLPEGGDASEPEVSVAPPWRCPSVELS